MALRKLTLDAVESRTIMQKRTNLHGKGNIRVKKGTHNMEKKGECEGKK